MFKLLLIVGPTASGKTSLALSLTTKFNAEIISADSRQVYKWLDVGTGKDVPKNLNSQISNLKWRGKPIPFSGNGTRIWGYDLVQPDEEFSVAHFVEVGNQILADIRKRGKLPIIVGGTGLYIKALTQPLSTISIPPDSQLRSRLQNTPPASLADLLHRLNPAHFRSMNRSDRANPRRLIRAIEIEEFRKRSRPKKDLKQPETEKRETDQLWIGLTARRSVLYRRIDERVKERLRRGVEREVRWLVSRGYTFATPAMSALGYIQWQPFLEGTTTRNTVIQRWMVDEHAYLRRQLTWFRANQKIHWFEIEKPGYRQQVVRLVSRWYSDS